MRIKPHDFLGKSPVLLFTVAVMAVYTIAGCLVYSDVVANGIFMFDDYDYILSAQETLWANMSDARFVGYLSFRLNEMVGGKQDAFGYHLVNVAVHILNGCLVYFLLQQLFALLPAGGERNTEYGRAVSALAGLIFVAHPLGTQSVSYITQRFTSLSTFFYLLAVCLYLSSRRMLEKRQGMFSACALYTGSILATILAMKTKEIAFTIPFMLLFFELTLFRESRYRKKRLLWLIPFAISLALIPLSIFGPDLGLFRRSGGVSEITRHDKVYDLTKRSAYNYLLTQFRVIVMYIKLLILPVNQAVVYDLKTSKSLFEPEVLGSLLFLVAIMLCGAYTAVKGFYSDGEKSQCYKIIGISTVWFFVTISIESSFIPIKDLIFEHRTYLPSVGAYAAVSAVIVLLLYKTAGHTKRFAAGFVLLVLVLAVPLGVMAYVRNGIWVDELLFWEDAVRSAPDKPLAYHNRAYAYTKRGMYEKALKDFDKAISYFGGSRAGETEFERGDLSPYNMSKAYSNRAMILNFLGQDKLAEEDINRSRNVFRVAALPDSSPVSDRIFPAGSSAESGDLYSKGKAMLKQGRPNEAVEIFTQVLKEDSSNAFALVNRGNALSELQKYPDAVNDYTAALKIKPDLPAAYHNRGLAYAGLGDRQKALRDIYRACGFGLKVSCDMTTAFERNEEIFPSLR